MPEENPNRPPRRPDGAHERPRRPSKKPSLEGMQVVLVQSISCIVVVLLVLAFKLVGGDAFAQLRSQFNESIMSNSILATLAGLLESPDASDAGSLPGTASSMRRRGLPPKRRRPMPPRGTGCLRSLGSGFLQCGFPSVGRLRGGGCFGSVFLDAFGTDAFRADRPSGARKALPLQWSSPTVWRRPPWREEPSARVTVTARIQPGKGLVFIRGLTSPLPPGRRCAPCISAW